MRINRLLLIGISLLWILSLLAACAESSSVTQTPQESVQPSAAPLPSATPLPPRELNICIGQEPQTLYLYGGSSAPCGACSRRSTTRPVDTRNYLEAPIILEELPGQVMAGRCFSRSACSAVRRSWMQTITLSIWTRGCACCRLAAMMAPALWNGTEFLR